MSRILARKKRVATSKLQKFVNKLCLVRINTVARSVYKKIYCGANYTVFLGGNGGATPAVRKKG